MKRILFPMTLLFVAACDRGSGLDRNASASISQKVADLERRLSATETLVASHQSRLDLHTKRFDNTVQAVSAAQVSVDDKGYGIVRNQHGAFLVNIEKAEPYLDGHKITFRIGNMAAATFSKPKLRIEYGPRMKQDGDMTKNYDEYLGSRKNKEENTLIELAPGSYTNVAVTIAPSTAEDLRDVSVSIELDIVELYRRK
jgi:hypothetical protein